MQADHNGSPGLQRSSAPGRSPKAADWGGRGRLGRAHRRNRGNVMALEARDVSGHDMVNLLLIMF